MLVLLAPSTTADGGLAGLLTLAGLVAAGVGLTATLRGRVRWARIGSRGVGGAVAAAGLVVAGIGGALAPVPAPVLASAGRSVTVQSSASRSPSSAPDPSPSSPAAAGPVVTSTATPSTAEAAPAPGTALAALATLPVKGRAPKSGYARAMFGQAWADVDRNGCDTRNDVLRRDLTAYVLRAGTHGCLVLRGTLHDPYTGRTIAFLRGQATSTAVQIDHVVALSDAWQKGAQRWSAATRQAFANDSLNLLAVDGPTNEAKGDGDAATWLPPVRSYRCAYVARQVAVKARYGLWVTAAEREAIRVVLSGCPGQGLPAARPFVLGGGSVEAASTLAPQPDPAPAATTSGVLDPRFGTCREATAQGYGPYVRGRDPEYDWYQDRDHDGVVCE
ncbi:MAG: GmrSD restriction endonuclease domain-containing protein [Nocardioidaceae bacterium]